MCGNNFLYCINLYAPLISALAVLLALIFSIYNYCQTKKLLKPHERPIISITEHAVNATFIEAPIPGLKDKPIAHNKFLLKFKFKNIGKHPAENFKILVAFGPMKSCDNMKVKETSVANRIDYGFEYDYLFDLHAIEIKDGRQIRLENEEFFIYVLLKYKDAFSTKKKPFCDEYFYTFLPENKSATFATYEQKSKFYPYVEKLKEKILKEK